MAQLGLVIWSVTNDRTFYQSHGRGNCQDRPSKCTLIINKVTLYLFSSERLDKIIISSDHQFFLVFNFMFHVKIQSQKNSSQASNVAMVVRMAETPCCFLATIMSPTLIHFLLGSSQLMMADLIVNPTVLLPS